MRLRFPVAMLLFALLGAGAIVYAQIEGGDRGVAPIDTSGAFEVSGIKVDVAARTADAARLGGWRLAQRKGWAMLWSKTHGGSGGAPALGDAALDAIVAGIVVDDEQIGPNRYVARLGVLFDRARAGAILGVSGTVSRSAPMLVVPVMWSGGTAQVFEARTEWQKAWARFRAGSSPIDYVRTSGIGPDPLLLNYGQTLRPGRLWWRALLDQYGAADVLAPQVRLERLFPGGPVIGHFSARFGPDNREVTAFRLRVQNSDAIPAMLDEGVRRIDAAYANALALGMLRPDPSLIPPAPVDPESLIANEIDAEPVEGTDTANGSVAAAEVQSFTVQFDTPDVGSVTAIETAVRGASGVRRADTTSLALGGISVMRVSFGGDVAALRAALSARGLRVEDAGGVIRIRRARGAPAPSPAADQPNGR